MPSCVSSNGILIVIENVLFAEEIPQNLLQVKNLIQKGMNIVFQNNTVAIKMKNITVATDML